MYNESMILLNIVILLSVVFISMTLHEVMHGLVAYKLGDDTAKLDGRLTLNPFKHIDPIMTIALPLVLMLLGAPVFGGAKPVPFNQGRVGDWGAALVALAGPLVNLVLAFIGVGVSVLSGASEGTLMGQILMQVVAINLGFFVFNMLPIPPLDGSRVLYPLAPRFIQQAMEAMEQYSLFIVFGIVMLFNGQITGLMSAATKAIFQAFLAVFGAAG